MTTTPSGLRLTRPLYGPSHPKGPSHGPDVVAVKRATARAYPSIFPWPKDGFDNTYNLRLEKAWRHIQTVNHFKQSTGQYGTLSHELLRTLHCAGRPGEWAFDPIAINLMSGQWEAYHAPKMTPEERVKAAMVDFMRRALNSASSWHYTQARPMSALGRAPELVQYSDCSTGMSEVIFWAHTVTGISVPDPMGRGWDGYGNTDTLWAANLSRRVTSNYEVGDMALYWAHGGHVIMCMQPGDGYSSEWWSNGSERAPNTATLHYRSDLRGVVRPRLVS